MSTVDNSVQVSSMTNQRTKTYSLIINQNILHNPEFRYFASLHNRPGPDSLKAFNQIMSKISQQSMKLMNAMLPHVVCKISESPKTRVTESNNMMDASPAALFDAILPRLKLGNDIHSTFKRVGETTFGNLQRLKEQNEIWLKIWEDGLVKLELGIAKDSLVQVKNAMMTLEMTMTSCLRFIHNHQMNQGW
jgi:hypothetical protein